MEITEKLIADELKRIDLLTAARRVKYVNERKK
jgi:hypothetical protein